MRVVLAPIGAGKTQAALHELVNTLNSAAENGPRFPKAWVLLATRRQEDSFRQRLVDDQTGSQTYFNVEFFNFYDLYRRILNIAGQPARFLSAPAQLGLLRAIITRMHIEGDLELYGPIAQTGGFVGIVAGLIAELKQNEIYPAAYEAAARTQKDRELSAIYTAYQETLQQHNLVDREGEGWLALARLQDDSALCADLDLLIVDGYDQFTQVQARLLTLLSERAQNALVTLTTVPEREATVGRRFQAALEMLKSPADAVSFADGEAANESRHPHLRWLVRNIFRLPAPEPLTAETSPVQFIEAPDKPTEVAATLRRVKRLLLDGCPPDSIMIALRDWEGYEAHLRTFSLEYGLPLALHYGEKLIEHPLISTLLDLMTLHMRGFPRRELLDVLRSPYLRPPGLSAEQVDQLERISQQFTVTRDPEAWLDTLLKRAHLRTVDEYGDDAEPIIESAQAADAFAYDLSQFFDNLTPPDRSLTRNYVQWLEDLIGDDSGADSAGTDEADDGDPIPAYTLNIIAALREQTGGDDTEEDITIARDLVAMQEFMRVLRGLVTAQELLTILGDATARLVTWEHFFSDLQSALKAGHHNPRPNRSGRVLVTTAADARGLPHQHLFILGLSEGLFPMPVGEDPLYLDSERVTLTKVGVTLKTRAERADDDGIFYELISLPYDSLTLSRPSAQDGQPWPESHLWRAAMAVFGTPNVQRLRVGEVVSADEAASLGEAMLATVDGLTSADSDKPPEAVGSLYNWLLQAHTSGWAHIHAARRVETRRLTARVSHHPISYDQYSGVLRDERLRQRAAETLREERVWSATQLNDYGVCGFRFFAKRLLKLDVMEEPEEGLDVLQRGSLIHRILEMTYLRVLGEELAISPDNTDAALDILTTEARDILKTAPEDFNFRPSPLWTKESASLVARLKLLVMRDFSEDHPLRKHFGNTRRYAYRMEAEFGNTPATQVNLPLPEGGMAQVRGVIDRIDRLIHEDGREAFVVMDYKSGTTKYKVDDMREGRNFQMIVYLWAAQTLLANHPNAEVAGGVFWHVPNNEVSGVLTLDAAGEVTGQAMMLLEGFMAAMREGDFAVQPSKTEAGRCVRYCEYHQLCRMCSLFQPSRSNA